METVAEAEAAAVGETGARLERGGWGQEEEGSGATAEVELEEMTMRVAGALALAERTA